MDTVTRVWIEDGCCGCHACVGALPEVFAFPVDTAVIASEARVDDVASQNAERVRLNAVGLEYQEEIREAAAGCPVDVIKFDAA